VRGGEDWWFEPANHDRIDLIPEKKRYEPGETAKFQVRMPFREASVLVTVEREGVLAQRVVALDGKSPVIEVPVIGTYGPNVYVSALAVRGRVDPEVPGPYAWLRRMLYRIGYWLRIVDEIPVERDTRPTALVDLAKPAYRLGIAEIKVGRRDYALDVKVTPDRDTFRVRETVRVSVQVTDSAGKPAANGEIALAAVDEGLLELMNNASWNILEGLMGERPTEVFTATAQGQVIGKRHFGKKAQPPGGGGGRAGARELFDTLILWKGRIALDGEGRAWVDVPLNDALTSFRIVAVAHAGAARFGHGATTVRTTKDLMLFSGLPPVVREQDEFNALFTLRNTTATPVNAELAWALRDRPADDVKGRVLANGQQTVMLAASEAKLVAVPVNVPVGMDRLYWEVTATGKENARDRLRVNQRVIEVHPVRVYQATLAQLDQRLQFPVERPAGAVPGRGGLRVELMGTLAGELTAVREYFLRYPYTCLEQRASKAIGLNDDALWNAVAASISNYLDRDGLARYFPVEWILGSDALTAYLVQVADDAGRRWPEETLARMLSGLEAFATGRITRGSPLPTADLTVRKLAAIDALSRHGRAKAGMLDTIAIEPALWPTSALIDWIGILKRTEKLPQRDERLKEAFSLLRSRLNFQGTVMTFSTERADALWWLMVSADANANRALIAVLDEPSWREDVGRLVRGSLSRQKRGHWGTTTANAWGTVAIARFAQAFEKTPATGNAVIALEGKSVPIGVGAGKQTREFDWPGARETLNLQHTGGGAPWVIVQSRAALPLTAPLFTGYSVKRTVAPVEQKDKSAWSRGDVYRVTLEIEAQTDMTWVVVDDPIPSGAAILGSGLGRDAGSLTQGEKREGWATPTFIERTYEAYRAYYEFVPKGRFKIEYTVRLNNPGRFDLPATRVEALYSPEMFGELPNTAIAVNP
jgi:alpha-2-macroglobulin